MVTSEATATSIAKKYRITNNIIHALKHVWSSHQTIYERQQLHNRSVNLYCITVNKLPAGNAQNNIT